MIQDVVSEGKVPANIGTTQSEFVVSSSSSSSSTSSFSDETCSSSEGTGSPPPPSGDLATVTSLLSSGSSEGSRREGAHQGQETAAGDPEVVATETSLVRFWVLFWFSVTGYFQCLQWNTWGPISESVQAAFPNWTPSTVAMMANWGTIMFVLMVVPMCWANQRFGLRAGTLGCAGLLAFGTALRCLPLQEEGFTIMSHICAILVGTSRTILMAAPPMLTATWFPPGERTTALAFTVVANQLGIVTSYLEPLLVQPPGKDVNPTDVKTDIINLMYIGAGFGAGIFLVVFIYFPAKPHHPPSVSSTVERLQFSSGIKEITTNGYLWLVAVPYSVSVGVPSTWASVLDFSLQEFGIYQHEAMWIVIVATLVSTVGTLVAARLTDWMYGFIKEMVMILLVMAMGSYYWFYLLQSPNITAHKWEIYTSVTIGMTSSFASVPLFFELAVEIVYPCPEVLVGGFMSATCHLVGVFFLLIFFIPNIGFKWMTYVLLGTYSASLIPMLFLKDIRTRSALDRRNTLTDSSSQYADSLTV
ncbi:solute carrier family 49 member 4 homolog isoform X2 [Oratosquilla oratoria]|uniref:solute carrier family 49 member 4 homolog isoform X2 n=1 Tax=Oratosquilla oratoria TaxID=337810 RepID=UPI003F75C4E0